MSLKWYLILYQRWLPLESEMKAGVLVKYIPSASSTFKWEEYRKITYRPAPGIIVRKLETKGTTTRRFEIRWHNGNITEEWISYLEIYK